MDFLDELQQRTLPGDGAMGTELLAAGAPLESCLEELCVSREELVRGIHEQYAAAGARVIRTNSFGANAVRLARHGCEHRVSEINWSAAQLAKDVAKGKGVYVAGSVGPLGPDGAGLSSAERHEIFTEQIGALLDGGCQLIMLETFLDVDELIIALHAKQSLHHCPAVAMLALDDTERLAAALARLRAAEADVVGVNCVEVGRASALLTAASDPGPVTAFPNAGLPVRQDGELRYSLSVGAFATTAHALVAKGARLIGGCCGVGPAHIAALAAELNKTFAPE